MAGSVGLCLHLCLDRTQLGCHHVHPRDVKRQVLLQKGWGGFRHADSSGYSGEHGHNSTLCPQIRHKTLVQVSLVLDLLLPLLPPPHLVEPCLVLHHLLVRKGQHVAVHAAVQRQQPRGDAQQGH